MPHGRPDGEYGQAGFTGVFFYDATTGFAHGYSPLSWSVLYAQDGKTHIAIPVRETETKSTFNDPRKADCIGAYRATALEPPNCKSPGPDIPDWGCLNDAQCG